MTLALTLSELPLALRNTVFLVTVLPLSASLTLTLTFVVTLTSFALFFGVVLVTVGPVVSGRASVMVSLATADSLPSASLNCA